MFELKFHTVANPSVIDELFTIQNQIFETPFSREKLIHRLAEHDGLLRVQTKTQNRFRDMIILNLRSGFEITETKVEEGKGLQIYLEKNLARS